MRLALILVLGALAGGARADPRPGYLPPASAGPLRAPAQTALKLRREPGKGWVYEHAGFVARVAEDGTVEFKDRHGEIHLAWPLPLPLPEGTGTRAGTVTPVERMSPYRPSPSEDCRYPHPCAFVARIMYINARGTFDLNDEILRLAKQDPYRNQKAAFLGATLAFRQELGQRAAARARARALEELRRRLDRIDKDPQLDAAERRAALQALADDLDPDPQVAAPARALIDARLAAAP